MGGEFFEIVASYTYDWESWFLPDGRVRWVNPAVQRMTGYAVEECLAMADYPIPIVHPDDRPSFRSLFAAALSGSSGNDIEFRIVRKDGSTGWAAVSWQTMIGAGGERLGVRTSMRDIFQRKRVEEALMLAKAEAERANLAKTRFLAAVSHDLRQPLQAIAMYIGALGHRPLDAATQEILGDIRLCLAATNEQLEELVDISRLDAGIVVPALSEIALADLFETVERSFRSEASDRKLDLRVMPTSLFVRSDPAIVARVLQNLVSNALRYTPSGRVLLGCRRRGATVLVEVWDTGIGIPAEETERIFEEFYQIGNQERDRRRGAGLGLAIVRRHARLLNAPISVRSRPGHGSMFSITLPLAESSKFQPILASAARRHDFDGLTIVIIDDESLQLGAMQSFLTTRRARVIAGQSLGEAQAQLNGTEAPPDLVIADYRLAAGMTGAEAVAAIRSSLGGQVPGILLTGDTEPQRIAEAEASGCRLIHKPVDPDRLAEVIAELTEVEGP